MQARQNKKTDLLHILSHKPLQHIPCSVLSKPVSADTPQQKHGLPAAAPALGLRRPLTIRAVKNAHQGTGLPLAQQQLRTLDHHSGGPMHAALAGHCHKRKAQEDPPHLHGRPQQLTWHSSGHPLASK